MHTSPDTLPALSIGAVERDTGLSKDILRVWERRYGFPAPARDSNGDRVYPQPQVEKLRAIRRLIDQGLRPGKLIPKSLTQLHEIADRLGNETDIPKGHEQTVADFLGLLAQHRVDDLRRRLAAEAGRLGLFAFLTELVATLGQAVGDAWASGRIATHEEHTYSHVLTSVLHSEIAALDVPRQPPRIVLATFPEESHVLGLLMAEALMAMEGAVCVSLGGQLPLYEIARGASANRADVVGVSFSAAYPTTQIGHGVADLRAQLPRDTELWVGGAGAARLRRTPPGVTVVTSLPQLRQAIRHWREHGRTDRSAPN